MSYAPYTSFDNITPFVTHSLPGQPNKLCHNCKTQPVIFLKEHELSGSPIYSEVCSKCIDKRIGFDANQERAKQYRISHGAPLDAGKCKCGNLCEGHYFSTCHAPPFAFENQCAKCDYLRDLIWKS
jgi:hypothetical protein